MPARRLTPVTSAPPPLRGPLTPAGGSQPELLVVLAPVALARVEHAAHVAARLREGDVTRDAERLAAGDGRLPPRVHLALPCVVRRERQDHAAVVVVEEVAQLPRPVGAVDLRRGEVVLHE